MKLRAHHTVRGASQLAAAKRAGFKIADLLSPDQEGSFMAFHRFHGPDGMAGTLYGGLCAAGTAPAPEPFSKSNHPVLASDLPRVSGSFE
jgi:hypothetical protein